jgi:hypothetical protein
MKLVEPLRELFKDEVRALGRELGLPDAFVGRHPVPGPGLAIRIPGEITREKLDILRKADAIYLDEIRKAGLVREDLAGVRGAAAGQAPSASWATSDLRERAALRAVTSVDGMTADFFHGLLASSTSARRSSAAPPTKCASSTKCAAMSAAEPRGLRRHPTSKPPGIRSSGSRRRTHHNSRVMTAVHLADDDAADDGGAYSGGNLSAMVVPAAGFCAAWCGDQCRHCKCNGSKRGEDLIHEGAPFHRGRRGHRLVKGAT